MLSGGTEREQWHETSYPICFQSTLSLSPENIRKRCGFFIFPGDTERVHWERMC